MSSTKRYIEKTWQDFLAKAFYPCEREVKTPVGNIDILTTTLLIEVKKSKKWKDSIGQLLGYGTYYPYHQKVLFLFGDIDTRQLGEVKNLCNIHKIDLIISFTEEIERNVVIRNLFISKTQLDEVPM